MLPVDPWAPNIDSQSLASQLFAFSLFPYIGFLYFITKSKSAPKLTLFGVYFLLAFVGATTFCKLYVFLRNCTLVASLLLSNRRGEEVFHLENTQYFLQSMSLLLRQVHLCIKPSIPTECSRYSKLL
ncbi:uncharacterized protein [Populus alba]|uniref:uncharacterized protein n=1 Tax=Populus alba TaxID=43335 RepID=UPI00158ADA54|nr:uncharacterized protein LOC118033843 isoform X2 [Populus alba]